MPASSSRSRSTRANRPAPARRGVFARLRGRLGGGGMGRWLRRVVLVLLLGPPALILAFRFLPVPATPLMLIRAVQGYGWQKEWVPYAEIAQGLPHAVIASEDNRFCEESLGFDMGALRGQIDLAMAGGRPRGASTITMQVAKNLFLWPGRDVVRKVMEAWLTPQIALLWPKQRVLEVYLNIVEFGPGIYGAEAAAQHFFHRPARDLSPQQAAQLAVVLPAPLEWNAATPDGWLRERAEVIRNRIGQLGPLLDCARR